MKKYIALFCILVLALFAAPGFANTVVGDPDNTFEPDEYIDESQEESVSPDQEMDSINTYGTSSWIELNHSIIGFSPLGSGEWTHSYDGWGYRSSGSNTATCHCVNLPSGAALAGYTVYAYDNSTGSVRYEFYRNNLATNSTQNILSYSTVGTPGYYRIYKDIAGSDHRVLNDKAVYWVCINNSVTGSSLRSSGVTFWYHLAISPAPATASFWDVPRGAPFFREIEALARSGITTGYSDGSYRPTLPVTRQAMAAFLSRALGLHWPDY